MPSPHLGYQRLWLVVSLQDRDIANEKHIFLKDKTLREDLLTALKNLNNATEHVQNSVTAVEKMSKDLKLRTDVKEMLVQARKTLDKVDSLLSRPGFGSDIKETLATTREAIGHLDTVARQLNQILDKRAPIMHLMFGRPGQLKSPTTKDAKAKDKKSLAPEPEPAPVAKEEPTGQTEQSEKTEPAEPNPEQN